MNVLFPTTFWCDGKFSSHTLIKITYSKECNAEENARIQLSSTKPDTKDIYICKNIKQATKKIFNKQFFGDFGKHSYI